MSHYRRNYRAGGTYFFTANLLDRNKHLLTDHIAELREAVAKTKTSRPFTIDAWVVLPDHLHTIWTLPDSDFDYSSRWREIKKLFSKSLPKTEYRSAKRIKHNERGIWQRRFWEHTLRDERDFKHHFDYIHYNPLKHGLVNAVKDWPYSTFHREVEKGTYTADWCGTAEESNQNYGEP